MDDKTVQAAAAKVKRENKANFANYLQKATGQVIDLILSLTARSSVCTSTSAST